MREPAIVIGAGPAGLATAAMVRRRGVEALVLERDAEVGGTWRRRYDSLRLHTVRQLSSLPGTPLPAAAGRYPGRDAFVAYLEQYAREHRLRIKAATEVHRIERGGGSLRVITDDGAIESPTVVVATGYCHSPAIPAWPGRDRYRGELMHSSQYRNAKGFRGKRVLVVGAGNSGADIALDAVRAGASAVWVSVRTPPQIVPRDVLGVPAQLAGIGLRRVPATIADPLARLERRLFIGDLSNVGLPVPRTGLFSHHRGEGGLPVLDAGFAHGAEQGMFRVVPAVEALEADRVRLAGGGAISPDIVIAATGYHTGLEPLVGHLGVLDGRGLPRACGGLWFTGFQNPISGALRELRFEAPAIARAVCSSGRC